MTGMISGWLDKLSRLTPIPLILRVVIFISAWLGLWLAAPTQLASPRYLLVLAVIALLPALAPGTRVVDVVMLVIVVMWIGGTIGLGEPVEPVTTFIAAAALYLTHAAATFAAALPYDAIVDGQVLQRWVWRCGFVLAAGALITVLVVNLATPLSQVPSVLALFAGLAIVVGLIALLASRGRTGTRRE